MAKQPTVKTAPSPVALLIDGENVLSSDRIADILAEIGKMGGVTVRRVYGNWAAPTMQPWKKILAHYALEWGDATTPPSGPNATDMSLTIGAMDLVHAGFKHFCLVTGDRDYVPLVRRLRQGGCTVVVIGTTQASSALKEAASQFLTTDQLLPQVAPPPKPRAKSATPQLTELPKLLAEAYRVARQVSDTEWVLLSTLGEALKQASPHFEEVYGKQQLSTRLKKFPHLFELRQKPGGKGKITEARLLASLQEVS